MVSTATTSAFHAKVAARLTSCSRACGVVRSVATLAIGDTTTNPMPIPQPRIGIRSSRRVLRKTLLSHMVALGGARAVALVVAKEDVLEARLVASERDDRIACCGLDHGVRRPLHREAHAVPVVQRLDFDHAVQWLESLGGNRIGKRDRDLVALDGLDLGNIPDTHEPPVPDDADG